MPESSIIFSLSAFFTIFMLFYAIFVTTQDIIDVSPEYCSFLGSKILEKSGKENILTLQTGKPNPMYICSFIIFDVIPMPMNRNKGSMV